MRLFASIIAVVYLLHPFGMPSEAPPPPLPWFIEHFNLEPFELPTGVSVDVVIDNGFEYLAIKNNSAITLYIAAVSFTGHKNKNIEGLHIEFPSSEVSLLYKIVNGQAYHWRNGWREGRSPYREEIHDSLWLHISDNSIVCDGDRVVDLEPLNQFSSDRPKDVKLPGPQEVLLPIIYGEEFTYIPLTISYTLNNDYKPTRLPNAEGVLCLIPAFFFTLVTSIVIILWILQWLGKKTMQKAA